jgi:hypothetical protein
MTLATNRQRKVLRFFGVDHSPELTSGAANWEIGLLLGGLVQRDRWRRYVYLTGDLEHDSDELRSFTDEELDAVVLPPGWTVSIARAAYHEELIADELAHGAPFDHPPPPIAFEGRHFLFTGKFAFGSRNACEAAVIERGANAKRLRRPTRETDFVIVGHEGSAAWKREAYGTKIEEAVLLRRLHGRPAIVSETVWRSAL